MMLMGTNRSNQTKIKMKNIFSFTASKDWFYRVAFAAAGLRSVSADLGGGTVMHCWVPKAPRRHQTKPPLLLIHGFGANAMWQYHDVLRHLTPHFDVYVPDLLFFGGSHTTREERTEAFQAQCLMGLMEWLGVVESSRVSVVGISYGGFVGYSMAAQFPEAVERVALCTAGVCLEERDVREGRLKVSDVEEAMDILVPQTPEKLRELMRFSFVKPAKAVPSFFLHDYIQVMCMDYVKEKKELLHTILKDRDLANLPKIKQETLIIWGEQDQIFPLELGYRLKRHLGDSAQLEVIKNAGHAVNLEKPKEFTRHLKSFLVHELPN